MTRTRQTSWLLALLLALMAGVLAFFVLAKKDVVVVGPLPIAENRIISANDLKLDKRSPGEVPKDAIRSVEAATGMMSRGRMVPGHMVVYSDLMPRPVVDPAQGMLAYTVGVNDVSGVAGYLQPGSYVAVFVTVPIRQGEIQRAWSKDILRNVRVLAYGPRAEGSAPQEGGASADGAGKVEPLKPKEESNATLEVFAEEAQILGAWANVGKLQLAKQSVLNKPTGARIVEGSGYMAGPPGTQTAVRTEGRRQALRTAAARPTWAPTTQVAEVLGTRAGQLQPMPVALPRQPVVVYEGNERKEY